MTANLTWGVLGAGSIARKFAKGVNGSETGRLIAVGSRSEDSANKFGDEFELDRAHRHAGYDALLADDAVRAVYIATPHPMHAQWAIRAAEAGKHILCEKPIGLNRAEAGAMIQAAREHGVFLMEAFMYRCHPQTDRILQIVRSGKIGRLQKIVASFGFKTKVNPDGRLFDPNLGGGGILDVGCYPVSMARLIAGAEPTTVHGVGHLGDTGVDEYAAAVFQFPDGVIAQVSTGVRLTDENNLVIHGTEGVLTVPEPWSPGREDGKVTMTLQRGEDTQTITVASDLPLYGFEADVVGRAIAGGKQQAHAPAMTWDDTLGNMDALDQWRKSIGLEYPRETPEGFAAPLHGRGLNVREDHNMRYGKVPGLDKKVSKLVMGCDNQRTFPHAAVMWDDWFERGGNAFDTGWVYGGGLMERLLGQWVNSRGVRDKVVVIGKGAHTPHCNPEALTKQLMETLDRLQTDHLDIYLMHRDNPDIPVGEFVDVLNEHRDAGRLSMFGGSNWTLDRIAAANDYAEKNGKTPMTALSDNFSLARMVDPVWKGCIAVSDPDSRAWLEEHQLANFSWSSQARGFFTERSAPDKTGVDDMLERCWYADDNFKRKARAQELAKKYGVSPITIAAAYVLSQDFPSFALIGPRQLSETHTSLPSLDIELSQAERRYLNLEADRPE